MQPPLHLFLTFYLVTVALETAVLVFALSRRHPLGRRLLAGVWLTACTYPVVWYVIPQFLDPGEQRAPYLIVAETFAPLAECVVFWLAFVRGLPHDPTSTERDVLAIVAANLVSFLIPELGFIAWNGLGEESP